MAALSRRLPSPPVPPINREEYAELARLSANLNQLARLAHSGEPVTVADALLQPSTPATTGASPMSWPTTALGRSLPPLPRT